MQLSNKINHFFAVAWLLCIHYYYTLQKQKGNFQPIGLPQLQFNNKQ